MTEHGVDHRLTTRQMAEFVTNGFLRFDAIVPAEINERAVGEVERLERERLMPDGAKPPPTGTPLASCYPSPSAIGDYLRLPRVQAIIESLVGPEPTFDHDWTHHVPAGSTYTQPLHVDAITDTLAPSFDIQLFWFLHDVAPGEAGTRLVPGSHLRHAPAALERYQHIRGEQLFDGPAGTVLVFHHGLWHSGRPNLGAADRWMHKTRLNPAVPQVRHWNTADLDELHNPPTDHMFATMQPDSVANTFRTQHPWHGVAESRNEQVQRSLLWRYLTGDDTYDVDHYLSRTTARDALAAR